MEVLYISGYANKTLISNFNAIEENDTLSYDTRRESLRYYSSFMISDDFSLIDISEEKFLKIMANIESFKTAGVERLPGSF